MEEVAFSLPQMREGIKQRKGKRCELGGGKMRKQDREGRKEPEEEERQPDSKGTACLLSFASSLMAVTLAPGTSSFCRHTELVFHW